MVRKKRADQRKKEVEDARKEWSSMSFPAYLAIIDEWTDSRDLSVFHLFGSSEDLDMHNKLLTGYTVARMCGGEVFCMEGSTMHPEQDIMWIENYGTIDHPTLRHPYDKRIHLPKNSYKAESADHPTRRVDPETGISPCGYCYCCYECEFEEYCGYIDNRIHLDIFEDTSDDEE
jgi:hypothetical protein